jgi:hypothetical protein
VAARQDWSTVQAILDYRGARRAVDLFNQGAEGAKQLEAQPGLAKLLLEIHRAQGTEVTTDGG